MSEDQRVSRNAQEPDKTVPAGAERWAAYLDWLREDLIEGILSLPPQEQRSSRLPSDWSPIELLSHLVHMEQRWFIWGFLGEPVAEPWGTGTLPNPGEPAAPTMVRTHDGPSASTSLPTSWPRSCAQWVSARGRSFVTTHSSPAL